MEANAKWTGVVNQEGTPGNHEFSIEVTRQDGIAVCGILRFTFPSNACAIRFKGAVNGQSVNFATYDPLAGHPTYPAICSGRITGDTLSGTWSVPSQGQKGQFQAQKKNQIGNTGFHRIYETM